MNSRIHKEIMEVEPSTSGIKRTSQASDISSKRLKIKNECHKDKKAGYITQIVLKNFMCHSMLEIKFSSNTTIMVGQNGSGKSAILTALVVGLGGKANLTNRGTSMKGFVKVGKNSGSVEITLCNEGTMAHKPKVYGSSITIIRKFTSSGCSSYKILDHSGKIVTNKFKEVKSITTKLNIQIDNPICVLNQDTSRNFLCSNDPKHKFSLFMKATRLEDLESDYKKIKMNTVDSIRLLNDKKNSFEKMQENLAELEQKIHQRESVKHLKDEENHLQIELLWSKVKDVEDEIETQTKIVEKLTREQNSFKENSSKRVKKIEQLKNVIKSDELELAELKNTIEVRTVSCKDSKKVLEKLTTLYETREREKKTLQTSIKIKNRDISVLEKELANVEQNKTDAEQRKLERDRLSEDLSQKIKAHDDILNTSRNDLFQIKSDLSRKEQNETNLKTEIRDIDQTINKYQSRINSLKTERGNTLLLYGKNTPRVKQLIEQYKNEFQQVPRGPLGSYIKIKDQKWAVAAEGFIGSGLLRAYVVDNRHDNQLLVQILKKAGIERMPTIITTKFFNKVHNVSQNLVRAPSDCASLFDVLEIEDPVVANCIIDQTAIEGILLVPNDERAMTIFSYRENVPRNCIQGVTIKGDRFYPDPNYRTYCSDYHHAQYFQVDTSEHIKQLESQIRELNSKKQAIMDQYERMRQEKSFMLKKQDELETKIRRLMKNKTELRDQLDKLKFSEEPEATDAEALESEMVQIKNVVVEKNEALEKIETEMKEISGTLEQLRDKMSHHIKDVKTLESRLHELQDKIREAHSNIREIAMSDDVNNQRIADFEQRLKEQSVIIQNKHKEAEKLINDAQTVGSRPHEIRKVHDIMEKLNIIGRDLRKFETMNESIEELIEKFNDHKEKITSAEDILNKLEETVGELKLAEKKRRKLCRATENYFIAYIKRAFKKILEIRQFQGSINIDMDKKVLELLVIPQRGSQGCTSTSNLSGGERSFSTVAFLYSLWQCMEFPFYFLDEFDVYMDKQNRAKVFDLLLTYSKSKPALQFVFLTPQDLSFKHEGANILRLEDPRKSVV